MLPCDSEGLLFVLICLHLLYTLRFLLFEPKETSNSTPPQPCPDPGAHGRGDADTAQAEYCYPAATACSLPRLLQRAGPGAEGHRVAGGGGIGVGAKAEDSGHTF